MPRTRSVAIVSGLMWLAHVGVVVFLGTQPPGPLASDLIQLILGSLLIYSIVAASQRSEGMARSFWRLTAIGYTVWFIGQALSVYNDFSASPGIMELDNLLFSFWFAPLAMAMFLDPDKEDGKIDTLVALDFVQAVLVCIAAYLYFFFIPKTQSPGELAHEVWAPYFIG